VAGDQLLQQFAGILRRSTGQGDILARLGGDEFVVLTDCSDMREIILFTEKMSLYLTEQFMVMTLTY
jgi:diguanylate cyclase (GGDEF)-like protein